MKELRSELSLTQEALAYKSGLDKTYVNEVENGKRNISIVNIEKLIGALESSFADFFSSEMFEEPSSR